MAGPPKSAKKFNKLAMRLAGRKFVPLWAALHHRGRKSGQEYSTPVTVMATDASFVIGLPWGRRTDWVRNVQASGGCRIRWKAVDYACTDPVFVEKDVAIAATRGLTRRIVQRMKFPEGFLQLSRRVAVDQPAD